MARDGARTEPAHSRGSRRAGPGSARNPRIQGSTRNGRIQGSSSQAGMDVNAHLPERFRGSQRRSSHDTQNLSELDPSKITLNLNIRAYMQAQDAVTKSLTDTWNSREEVPSNEEVWLVEEAEVAITPNKIQGRWKSKEKYLRAHYELLREDSVSPLRDAVDKIRQYPDMNDDQNVAVYENVHLAGITLAPLGIAFRIKFSTARAGKSILWQSSKRLVSGSIVALTPAQDKFRTKCVVAIVAARPLAGVEAQPPEIDIYFGRADDIEIDPQQEWLMIESKQGYYEAMRHTMRAIQKMSTESFPLANFICSLDNDISQPDYVLSNPRVSLSAINEDSNGKNILREVDLISAWPEQPPDNLDKTQWEAMQHILTKQLAIIQGPPGTGKTHVSKTALQILCENRRPDDPPIIVAAQTNHALDQLLGHVSKFDPNFIRLGGRSTSAEIKKRALYEVRQRERVPQIPGSLLGMATKQKTVLSQEMQATLSPLIRKDRRVPYSVETLLELKIISQKQADSLNAGAAQWVTSENETHDAMFEWVGKHLIPFEVTYKQEHFGFEEADEDLEFEQLREHEAEHGVADEEDIEILKGPWSSIHDRYKVADVLPNILDMAKKQLDTMEDLWKVRETLRGPIYSVMQQKAKTAMLVKFREQAHAYDKLVQDIKIGRWERDAVFLSQANIVGMTTTGLSKYRCLVASLNPKIVLIEEAAEVIEAPVTVACVDSLEHLILVGDHQQLQGHCSVSDLEGEPYNLNVSMFERLVTNGVPFKTLLRQRRMDPEFRRLLAPIYPKLEDHPVVLGRRNLDCGMGDTKSFFLNHNWLELRDSHMSTYNDREAEFVAGFYGYLLKNGVSPKQVTILTLYNGQRKRILHYLRLEPTIKELYNDVKTVDSFQGEENDVIILSLVRSNEEGKIGFLDNSNRVCVALSRAKSGFYIFGNGSLLANKNSLWANVVRVMGGDRPNKVDTRFPVKCKNHGLVTFMVYPEDWKDNHGGCENPCGGTLLCGHPCTLKCHPYEHERLQCFQRCGKLLNCGHDCARQCGEHCYCDCEKFLDIQNSPPNGGYPPASVGSDQASVGQHKDIRSNKTSPWTTNPPGVRGNNSSNMQNHTHAQSYFIAHEKPRRFAFQDQTPYPPANLCSPSKLRTSRPSDSSGTLADRSSNYSCGVSGSSQFSFHNQNESQKRWNVFANGGARVEDKARILAEERSFPRGPEASEDLLTDFEGVEKLSMTKTSPVKSQTLKKLSDGRIRYDQNVQFDYRTSNAPKVVVSRAKSSSSQEQNLLG